jgi:hypothetical protein
MDNIKKENNSYNIPWNIIILYVVIIFMTYIYYHCVIDNYGDIISKGPVYDVLGDKKCIIKYKNCNNQVIDGWLIVKFLIYGTIGYLRPHLHGKLITFSILKQLFLYSKKTPYKYILNPLTVIAGYSSGALINKIL